ncbi:DUF7563 family protein [Haloarcula laminariae]
MPECTHCGGHVSRQLIDVFGDKHSRVYACSDCAANANIVETTKKCAKTTAFSDDAPERS